MRNKLILALIVYDIIYHKVIVNDRTLIVTHIEKSNDITVYVNMQEKAIHLQRINPCTQLLCNSFTAFVKKLFAMLHLVL